MNTNDSNEQDRDTATSAPPIAGGATATAAAVADNSTSRFSRIVRRINPFGTSKLR